MARRTNRQDRCPRGWPAYDTLLDRNQSGSKRAYAAKRPPGLDRYYWGNVLNLIRKLPVLFLLSFLPVVNAASYVFVFHGDTVTASVYDAESLDLVGTPVVGRRAALAFGVTSKQAPNAFEKFYVVTHNSVVILNSDFSARGTVFLEGMVPAAQSAATLSPDGSRLLIASGDQVVILDTSNDSILASVELVSTPTGVAVDGSSNRAYIISSASRWVRVLDLVTNQLEDLALEMPSLPATIASSADGSGVYIAGQRSIYQIDEQVEGFLKPILAMAPESSSASKVASGDDSLILGEDTKLPESVYLNGGASIDKLILARSNKFYLRAGADLLQGILNPGGTTFPITDPESGQPFNSSSADIAASPDGRMIFIAESSMPRLARIDTSGEQNVEEVILASKPTAVALTAPPTIQAGTLEKFSGDGQMVQSGSAYSLVARTLDEGDNPESGVFVFVDFTTPVSFCSSPSVPTDSDGLATISCTGAVVTVPTVVTILTRDSEGRIPAPPFSVVIVPPSPVPSGLRKKSGDGQVVAENASFVSPLVVTDFTGAAANQGVSLSVTTSPNGVVSCVVGGLIDAQGLGTIDCSALSVAATTVVQISVSDSLGQSLAHPFNATVTDTAAPTSGLTKVSGDGQTVLQNTTFPTPLVVSKRVGGLPQSGVQVNVSTLPAGVLSCTNSIFTDFNGLASISCSALSVGSITTAQIFVSDTLGDSLDQPFSATILPFVPTDEGLTKVSGDEQLAPQNGSLPAPLVVSAVLDGTPQSSLQLTITSSNTFVLCPAIVFTNGSGLASISCSTGLVATAVPVLVTARDASNRSVTFSIIVAPTNPDDVERIFLLSDDHIEGMVGELIPDSIRVRAVDGDSNPVAGVAVFFFSANDVTFNPPVAVTNVGGHAETLVTLGCDTSVGKIRIGVAPDDSKATVTFQASTGPPSLMTKTNGDNQSGAPGETLDAAALVVTVSDVCGNGIRGESVIWSVNPPEAATLTFVFGTTDRSGKSSAIVQLGNRPGPFTVTATSGGLSATFNLSVTVLATQLALISGNNQTVALGQAALQSLVVEARDAENRAVPGVPVIFAVTQGSGTVSATGTVETNALGRAQTFVTAGAQLGTIRVVASGAGGTVTFTINTTGRTPSVTALGFVNGASFRQGWVPGSLGTIFGVGLMEGITGVVEASQVPFPTILRGVRVIVNGISSPILSIANVNGQEQISIQVPFGISAPGDTGVIIENNGSRTTVTGVPLFTVQPGVFEFIANGVRVAAVLHADFQPVTPANPARPNEIVLLFITGMGLTNPAVGTNVVGPAPPATSVLQPVVGIDDAGVEVLGSFYAPGLMTVFQINLRIPGNAQTGNRKLSVIAGGGASQNSLIPIKR